MQCLTIGYSRSSTEFTIITIKLRRHIPSSTPRNMKIWNNWPITWFYLTRTTRFTTNTFGGNRILKCDTHKKTKTKACAIYAPLSTTRHYQRKSIEIWPIGGKINPIVCLHHQYPDLCKTLISWLFNSVVVLSKVNVNFFCSKTVLSRKSQYIKSFITFLGRFFISLV